MGNSILDKLKADASAKPTTTSVNTRLSPEAYALVRQTHIESGLTLSQVVAAVVDDALGIKPAGKSSE